MVWYQRQDDRRLDYRALAEALRVRYFWGLAGLTRSVAANYMGQLEGEMSWARRALYAVSPPPREWKRIYDSRTASDQQECLIAVANRWVSDQKDYYHREHRHAHNCSTALRVIGLLLALTGWGLSAHLFMAGWVFHVETTTAGRSMPVPGAVAAAVPSRGSEPLVGDPPGSAANDIIRGAAASDDADHGTDARHPEHLVLIFSSLLVIGGGLMIAYGERRGYDALARQYGNMHTVFERGERELDVLLKAQKWDDAREVIRALGDEGGFVEHVQWLVLHRVHPFEMIIEG